MCSIHTDAPRREEGMNMTFNLARSVSVEAEMPRDDSHAHLMVTTPTSQQGTGNGVNVIYKVRSTLSLISDQIHFTFR